RRRLARHAAPPIRGAPLRPRAGAGRAAGLRDRSRGQADRRPQRLAGVAISLLGTPSLDASVKTVGANTKEAAALAKLGIQTVRDLLLELPYGREEYGMPTPVSALKPGEGGTVVGTLVAINSRRPQYQRKNLKLITEGRVAD